MPTMQLPKIDVQPMRLAQILNQMESGLLQVPRFQREFVWPLSKIRDLLDSMYKEFPIGSFFLWHAPPGSPTLFRSLSEIGIPEPRPGFSVSYILDGQQRLTSLFVAINGKKVNGQDYGKICIDLDTATRYELNTDEGFEEPIFVNRAPDDRCYIAVSDLVGPRQLMIYNGIPDEWKPAFTKAGQIFQTYPFSVVWIQEQTLADAIVIFQRINQSGKPLSRFDLVCANVWTEEFDFRTHVANMNSKLAAQGFGEIDETIFTQTFALILKERCTTDAELSLQTSELERAWDAVTRALELAISFASANLGVKQAGYLPYRGILPVLAYYFYHQTKSAISARERDVLWQWFWRVTLSERYGSTSPSRMAEDAKQMLSMLQGAFPVFSFPSRVTPEAVAKVKMTQTGSALRNAIVCLLALRGPRNLKDGSPVNPGDPFFSDLKKPERHHIFPAAYLKKQGLTSYDLHLAANFCFIPADLNKEITSKAPSDYLGQYRGENPDFAAIAQTHLLPVGAGSAVWRNDFAAFIAERARILAEELNRLADARPGQQTGPQPLEPRNKDAEAVSQLEVKIRDFIDAQLTAVAGPDYWRRSIPGDIKMETKEKIAQELAHHPYQTEADFVSGRRRLDFCDVSHYEKIINYNWASFEEVFRIKAEMQRHFGAYRLLRNAVQHNRQPNDIESQLGRAAMVWIERTIDRYRNQSDHDASASARAD